MSRNISAAVLATTLIILHSKNKKSIKTLLGSNSRIPLENETMRSKELKMRREEGILESSTLLVLKWTKLHVKLFKNFSAMADPSFL